MPGSQSPPFCSPGPCRSPGLRAATELLRSWSCVCPGGVFGKSSPKLDGKRKAPALHRVWGAPAVLVPRVRLVTPQRRGLHAQGGRTRQGVMMIPGDQARGDTGTERSRPLLHRTLWSPCDRNGCKTQGEALPRYPCFKGSFGSAALPCWRPPPLQEAFFSNTGEIFLLISFNSNLYTLQAKHFGNRIRLCRGCGRNLFLFPFLSLFFLCSDGFPLLQRGKVSVIFWTGTHYASPHKCKV